MCNRRECDSFVGWILLICRNQTLRMNIRFLHCSVYWIWLHRINMNLKSNLLNFRSGYDDYYGRWWFWLCFFFFIDLLCQVKWFENLKNIKIVKQINLLENWLAINYGFDYFFDWNIACGVWIVGKKLEMIKTYLIYW